MCFFNSIEESYFEKGEDISPLKNLIGGQYSFLKVTQFSQGNNLLTAPASYLYGFLSRDICVSSTQIDRLIWNKMYISPP
jgi:hypothetical protein